jgi:ankyrin repeat protein
MDNSAKFFRACRTGNTTVIRALLEKGVDVNSRDEDHLTGLIWAGRKGKIESALVLLEHGAEIELGDKRGRTALFHAATFGRCDFVEYLASAGANVNPIDSHGCTPLDIAIMEYPKPGEMVPTLEKLGGIHTNDLRPNNSFKPKPLRGSA